MHSSILPVTTHPGQPPGICAFLISKLSISHLRANKESQFPTPETTFTNHYCTQTRYQNFNNVDFERHSVFTIRNRTCSLRLSKTMLQCYSFTVSRRISSPRTKLLAARCECLHLIKINCLAL